MYPGDRHAAHLAPPPVITTEAFGDDLDDVFPGEEDLIAGAVHSRRAEFVTARRCAREALSHLGYPPGPIRRGTRREPLWPSGVVGSITHCSGYRAAVVAPADAFSGLGLDAEPHDALPTDVAPLVLRPTERSAIAALAAQAPGVHWDRLMFSAKESVYKACYPMIGGWIGFEEVELTVDPTTETFRARLLLPTARTGVDPPPVTVHGRYRIGHGLVLTAVVIPSIRATVCLDAGVSVYPCGRSV